jgi:N-dimethylarginine dimethylaminohydrolase
MKLRVRDVAVAAVLGAVGGHGRESEANITLPPETALVSKLDIAPPPLQLLSDPPVMPVVPPPVPLTPEAIKASNIMWKALCKSGTWDYSKLFMGRNVSVGLSINATQFNEFLDGKLTMLEIAEGYRAMTGQNLLDIAVDARLPEQEDIQAVASQIETHFFNFRDIGKVGEKASILRTVKEGEAPQRLLMAIPRQPVPTTCKEGTDRLHHWCALQRTLQSLGASVINLDPMRPRAVPHIDAESLEIFTRDPVLVLHDRKEVLVPDFAAMAAEGRPMSFDPHVPAMVNELMREGYTAKHYKGHTQGGDFIYDPHNKLILVGLDMAGFDVNNRFTAADAKAMEKLTGCKVIRVKRMAYKLYHLDTAIAPLPGGKYLINPAVTDDKTYAQIKQIIGEKNIIEIPREEERYVANLIAVGNSLVMPACGEELEKRLKKEGFTVVTPEKVGLPAGAWDIQLGSVHCMTQQVRRNEKETEGKSFHAHIRDENTPFHRRMELERRLRESRAAIGKC